MTWPLPADEADPEGHKAKWIYSAVALAALIISTVAAVIIEDATRLRLSDTLGLAALAAAWNLLVIPLYPQRTNLTVPVLIFYAGFVAISLILVSRSPAFVLYASASYLYAFAFFSARSSIFAVAATAILLLAAQSGTLTHSGELKNLSPYLVVFTVAVPIGFAGWNAGRESERRQKANRRLVEANQRLERALAENAALQSQLLVQAREAGVLEERQRMAREMHDTLAQGLIGIITQLEAISSMDERSEDQQHHLDNALRMARENLIEARRSVDASQPVLLERVDLPEALAEVAQRWSVF